MTKQEREFMFDLAELMAKHGVSLEATTFNESAYETPSIQIQKANGEIDIDLYGCLYPADIMQMSSIDNPELLKSKEGYK